MKNVGTLVGATVRINDSQDAYPVALQSEVKGGHHSKSTLANRDAIPAHLREPGMTCYVSGNGKTYELGNDLVTWSEKSSSTANGGGGTTDPGTGGDSVTTTIISGNFGAWTDIPGKSADLYDEQLPIKYKADITAFGPRSIVYLTGQFGLNSAFVGTEITLGTLPAGAQPTVKLKKYFICKNVELFLQIETTGEVKIISKDGFNLPVTTDVTEDQPYYIDIFFHPYIADVVPTEYTATRSEDFTRDNCGSGYQGSTVTYTKTYTSIISQADADAQAANDPDFANEGQAYARTNGTCQVVYTATRSQDFTRNDCGEGYEGTSVTYTKTYTSIISQADADAQAANDANFITDGQDYANTNGSCSLPVTIIGTVESSGDPDQVEVRLTLSDALPVDIFVTASVNINGSTMDCSATIPSGWLSKSVYVFNPSHDPDPITQVTIDSVDPNPAGGITIIIEQE